MALAARLVASSGKDRLREFEARSNRYLVERRKPCSSSTQACGVPSNGRGIDKDVSQELISGNGGIASEIGHSLLTQHCIVDQAVPSEHGRRLAEDRVGGIGHDFRLPRLPEHLLPT